MEHAYKHVWAFVIRRDFVQTKRAKCEVCRVGRCLPRLACWACIPLIRKTPGGWQPGAETRRRLIYVINCKLLSTLVG